MKGAEIILDHLDIDGEQVEAAALLVDGQLEDLLIDADAPRPGTIYRALADRPVKGQGGMFLKTPEGSAFLRQVKGLSPGEPLLVQLTGHPEEGKALPVTGRLLFKSRYAIVTPGAPGINVSRAIRDDDARDALQVLGHEVFADHPVATDGGLILRSAAEGADEDAVAEDIAAMADLAAQVLADDGGDPEKLIDGPGPHDLAWRDWTGRVVADPGSFADRGVLDLLDALASDEVPLGNGGRMFIEATRAAITVDINTGGDNSPAAGFKANLAAARDLPRQLRLRGLGGQIYIDLAPMGKKDRRQFETSLKAAFRADATETVLAGWTPLGNFELQRKRDRLPSAAILRKLA